MTRPSAYTFHVVVGVGLRPMRSLPVVGALALTPSGGKPAKCMVEADPAAATAGANASARTARPVVLMVAS
jgi:hypothetical protein